MAKDTYSGRSTCAGGCRACTFSFVFQAVKQTQVSSHHSQTSHPFPSSAPGLFPAQKPAGPLSLLVLLGSATGPVLPQHPEQEAWAAVICGVSPDIAHEAYQKCAQCQVYRSSELLMFTQRFSTIQFPGPMAFPSCHPSGTLWTSVSKENHSAGTWVSIPCMSSP